MVYASQITISNDSAEVSKVLLWVLVLLLAIIFLVFLAKFITKMRSDNSLFYTEEGAINLRIDRMPDIRVATKNCKDFKVSCVKNTLTISYANPFGGVKQFECNIVGDPIRKPFELLFNEQDFKKLCFHLKPGMISIFKNRITFNYNNSVRCKFVYLKKGV